MLATRPERRSARGILLVATTYTYFLLFAQFGFLRLLHARLSGAGEVRLAMTAMGVAGLFASLLTAVLLERWRPARLVRLGYLGCAAAALLALPASSLGALAGVAAAIGAATGLLTVALAVGLRDWLPGRGWAVDVGIGTGAAYLVCNLPPLFEASPAVQVVAVAAVCLAGVAATGRVDPRQAGPAAPARGGRRLGFAAVLLSFMALIWIDSAAFAVIQDSAELKALTWGGPGQKMVLGGLHLLAALGAGWLLRRRRLRALLLATFALFAVSFAMLARPGAVAAAAGPLYVVGISFYSVALIVYAARRSGAVPGRWRAALVYGIAGWLGSALGVGMAQDLHTIPAPLIAAAGLLILGNWLAGRPALVRTLARVYGRTAVLASLGALLSLGLIQNQPERAAPGSQEPGNPEAGNPEPGNPEPGAARLVRGREVYLAEGCINCHSSLVRCGTADEELWGPCGAPPATASPPLIGNRRQGPDLLNAGNRRSPEWHRLHLMDPRALSPGSRMPGYAHLFEDGRGDDLVAWLADRGAESRVDRFTYTQTVAVADPAGRGSRRQGAALFARHCAGCHGDKGRGDGALGEPFRRPAMNLAKGSFWLVPRGPGVGTESEGLARVIRFGVPGTSMPGHEYFSDREVADLAAFVQSLAPAGTAARGATP